MPGRCTVGVLGGLVLTGLALRLAFFSGYPGTDDKYYIEAAYRVSVGDFSAFDSHFAVRSGLVMPTAAAYAVFGPSLATSVLLPLVCSAGSIVVTFLFARHLFGDGAGLVAAGLLVVFPLDVIFASELFACAPATVFAGLTAFFVVRDSGDDSAWSAWWAGVCLGVAALMGDTALFCLIPIAGYFTFVRPRVSRAVALLGALVLVIALESALYLVIAGDPFLRWRVLARAVAVQGNVDVLSTGLGWGYVVQPFVRVLSEQELGLFPIFIAAALWYHVRASENSASVQLRRFLVFWVVSILLYTWFGTTSPFRFAPLPRLPRYLAPIVVTAMVLLGAFLMSCRPRVRHASVAALCLTSVLCVWIDNGRNVKDARRALHAFLVTHAADRFVLDAPLMFDELVFRGFRSDPRLSVFVLSPAEAGRVEAKRSIYGQAVVVRDVARVTGAFIAVTRPPAREQAAALPNAERVAILTPPDRLYYRLLRSPQFLRVLSLVRDSYRVAGFRAVSDEQIDVYRIP